MGMHWLTVSGVLTRNPFTEAKDGDKHPNKLGRLLRQWSDLQHDVVPRVREMITSQTMLQQASSRLSTLRGDAPGKTPRRTPRMLSSRRHTPASTPRTCCCSAG